MAYCVQCKNNVGCGCQLVNGLCSTCRAKNANPPATPNTPNTNNNNTNVNQSVPNNQ